MDYVKDLESFKLAHDLTKDLYQITEKFSGVAQEELGVKIRDKTADINANLLAGSQLNSSELYREAVNKSKILLGQVDYYLLLAKDLDYLSTKTYSNLQLKINQLSKILSGMRRAL